MGNRANRGYLIFALDFCSNFQSGFLFKPSVIVIESRWFFRVITIRVLRTLCLPTGDNHGWVVVFYFSYFLLCLWSICFPYCVVCGELLVAVCRASITASRLRARRWCSRGESAGNTLVIGNVLNRNKIYKKLQRLSDSLPRIELTHDFQLFFQPQQCFLFQFERSNSHHGLNAWKSN